MIVVKILGGCLVIFGLMLLAGVVAECNELLHYKPVASRMSAANLVQNGPGDNCHILLTDFRLSDRTLSEDGGIEFRVVPRPEQQNQSRRQ